MPNMAPVVYRIGEEFRRRKKKVVMGGMHVTVCADEAQRHCDAVIAAKRNLYGRR